MATEFFSLTPSKVLDKPVHSFRSVPAKMTSFLDPIDHYAGLVGKVRLLYTSQYPTEPTYEYGYSARKQVSTIGSHPVVGVFENNIRG